MHSGFTLQPKLKGLIHPNTSWIDVLIMLLVLENSVKQPTYRMKGFATMPKLWLELLDKFKKKRKMVLQRVLALNKEGVLKAHHCWKETKAHHEQVERASTSLSAIQALPQALR
jgi:hypothetical protein